MAKLSQKSYDTSAMVYRLKNSFLTPFILSFLGGTLYAFGFPSIITKSPLPFLPIIGYLIFFAQLSFLNTFEGKENFNENKKSYDFSHWFLFSLGYNLIGYYWIPNFLTEFGEISGFLNFFTSIIFSLILLPQVFIFIALFKIKFLKKMIFKIQPDLRIILFSIGLVFLEYYSPQQFPAHLGHPWLGLSPYLGMAPIFGAPAFSFFSFWLVFSFLPLFRKEKIKNFLPLSLFFIFLLLNFLFKIPPIGEEKGSIKNLNVRLVQANIGNFMKLDSESGKPHSILSVTQRYFKLSTQPLNSQPDLIVWPETSYPLLLSSSKMKENKNAIPIVIRTVASKMQSEVFFGGYDRVSNKVNRGYKSEYNSAFLVSKEGSFKNVYHKHRLIPFGEGLPFGPLNPFLSRYIKNISFFAEGKNFPLFKTSNQSSFISAICYEILFSSFIRKYLNKVQDNPHFLINLTNDSWYGDTIEPFQHLFLSHWRAIEFNLPIIRMTNTGISSILLPDGSEQKRTGVFKQVSKDYKFK
ncbi:MAG: apolipoprotein N-acyltransferase [Bdellovibrionota bacterium]|nr:apolipoprotein N-acyltransferase [Bdellovibrionota bacterium]